MPTILERLLVIHDEATARTRLLERFVRADGVIVTDPDTEVATNAKIVLQPPTTEHSHN